MVRSAPLALAAAGLLASGAAAAPNPKRGVVADGCTGASCPDGGLLTALGWHYAYNYPDPWAGANGGPYSATFVPMSWCVQDDDKPVPSYVNTSIVMGFNEPNNAHNCNIPASTAAQAWGGFVALFPKGTQFVSPATAGNGTQWFDEFFAACKSQYGAGGCAGISRLAVHWYGCTPDETLSYLKFMHDRYGLPVWLTEFSCGDGAQGKPQADHLKYMKAVVPLLDAAPFVERYAWMSARSANRGLVDSSGKITPVGELYNTV